MHCGGRCIVASGVTLETSLVPAASCRSPAMMRRFERKNVIMNHVMKEKNLKMRIFLLKHPDKGICMFDRSTS